MHNNNNEVEALDNLIEKLKRNRSRSGIEIGKVFDTKDGLLEIIEYKDANTVTVKFLATGTVTTAQAGHILSGKVKDRYAPSVCGIGHLGETECQDSNGAFLASYRAWKNALQRVTSRREYSAVTVADNFRCFADFQKWYEQQAKPFNEQGIAVEVDKDLLSLIDGLPKSYDLGRCCLLPKQMNIALRHLEKYLKRIDESRDDEPVYGASFDTKRQLIRVSFYSVNKKQEHFGWFKANELPQAKALLRKARIKDFLARCDPYRHLLPNFVQQALDELSQKAE